MARNNKIYAGPYTEPTPQVVELPAAAALLAGSGVVISAGKFAVAGASNTSKVRVVQDNYLQMKGVDDAIPLNETAISMELLSGHLYYLRVPTATNIARDAPLTTDASGKFITATAGKLVVAHAEEAYNNTTGEDQLVLARAVAAYLLPAA